MHGNANSAHVLHVAAFLHDSIEALSAFLPVK
jgi:hypothetical protein